MQYKSLFFNKHFCYASLKPRTWFGLQLAATFQLPLAVLVQAMSAAGAMAGARMQRAAMIVAVQVRVLVVFI